MVTKLLFHTGRSDRLVWDESKSGKFLFQNDGFCNIQNAFVLKSGWKKLRVSEFLFQTEPGGLH